MSLGSLDAPVALGSLHGSVYGGHAPVVGAHVFVLQASTGGYGLKAASLLTANPSGTAAGGTATATEVTNTTTSGYGTAGYNYVTTDMYGVFNISGEYTCSPGLPVYLLATGGTTEIAPNSSFTGGTAGNGTATFTNGINTLVSVGQIVTFSTVSTSGGTNAAAIVGALNSPSNQYTVTATPTPSTFTVTGTIPAGSATITGGSVTVVSPNNPHIGQMAVLGLCPTPTPANPTPAENFSSLSYIYLNEVSTVAAAYSLGGFMTDSSNSLHSVDAVHLSVPGPGGNPLATGYVAGSSPAWVGLQNATLNAAQIYDIQGKGAISTSQNGEGHIANATTPIGNGTVSQGMVNQLANALASCVDSGSTATAISTPCNDLLNKWALPTASGAGGNKYGSASPTMSGVPPTETATAAINLAHNPWNPNYSDILFTDVNETSPYAPAATTAKDLAVTISYPMLNVQSGGNGGIAIDQSGNAWVTSYANNALTTLSPQGNILFQDKTLSNQAGMVAIDSKGAAWVALRDNTSGFSNTLEGAYKFNLANPIKRTGPFGYNVGGSLLATDGLFDNIWVAIDGNDNAYFTNHVFNNTLELSTAGAITGTYSSGSNPLPGVTNRTSSTYDGPFAVVIDGAGRVWTSINQGLYNNVTRFTTSGTTPDKIFGSQSNGSFGGTSTSVGTINDPVGMAVDNGGNVWVASNGKNHGSTSSLASTGATIYSTVYQESNVMYEIVSGTDKLNSFDGSSNGLQNSVGVAIDGNGLAFFSCPGIVHNDSTSNFTSGNGDIAVFNSGTSKFVTGNNGITGTSSSSTPLVNPYFMAVDNAGNLWVNTSTTVVQYLGIATPVLTPLASNLTGSGGLARKP